MQCPPPPLQSRHMHLNIGKIHLFTELIALSSKLRHNICTTQFRLEHLSFCFFLAEWRLYSECAGEAVVCMSQVICKAGTVYMCRLNIPNGGRLHALSQEVTCFPTPFDRRNTATDIHVMLPIM